jgi:glycosyltransferase involved in cell wall biosynthesis
MNRQPCNIVIMGVSCFDGMASSMRVRNLFEPLIEKKLLRVANLIYQKDNKEPIGKAGVRNNIAYKVIDFKLPNVFSFFGFWGGGFKFIKQQKQRDSKNVLYNYNYPDAKNILFILYAKLIGYKIVFDIVEDNTFEAGVSFVHKLRLKSSLFLFNVSRYFSSAMVGISNHLYNRILTITKNKVPAYLIPITVNLKYFTNTTTCSNNGTVQIFYGGSFGTKDGLEYLISAFDEICNTHTNAYLILTGVGHKRDMDRIRTQIDNARHKDKILYKGFLSTEVYYKMLNECDIFCMTRVNSKFANAGFPFKLGEFLASGKAVIATSVGDVPNYLFNNENAFVIQPDSVSELTAALNTAIANPEKRKMMGAAARKTAETHFDSDKISLQLLSIFQSL